MAVKFPLKMSDVSVRTMEELREHFDLRAVLDYYSNGRLAEWLEDRFYDEEAKQVRTLDASSENFKENLCRILGVPYLERVDAKIDLGDIARKNERREHLKKYTTDDRILASVDSVAFTQKELKNLLKRIDSLDVDDDDNKVIYLCGENFTIPGNIGGIVYKGVNNPIVEFDTDIIEAGIDFQDLEFDISNYVDNGNYGKFLKAFDNNLVLGVKLLQQAAEHGNADAQFILGMCYMEGDGVEEDGEEAAKWFEQAAEQGHVDANVLIYTCFRVATGDGEYAREAAKWFLKAIEQDSLYVAMARNKLVEWYMLGIGVEQNFEEAVKLSKQAVRQDEANAKTQYYLGHCYFYGEGVGQSDKEAAKWFEKAAEQGNADAQFILGMCYAIGRGVKQNHKEAVKWYSKAAEQGDANAQAQLGICYSSGDGIEQDYEEAIKWYRKSAVQGNMYAQGSLGILYAGGLGAEQNFLEAVKWFRRAAEQGDEEAQEHLEICCDDFMNIDAELVRRYQEAAEHNNADAQNYLGLCYEEGRGIEPDIEEAQEWYSKAAEQGHADAQSNLSRCLFSGFRNITQEFADMLKSFGED